ncbi:MAG: hypothetical protein ACKOW9_03665 [Candidatus Paceibacterota bacterium]
MTEPAHNFRDISLDIKDSSLTGGLTISYNKVNKLITALYIVTDILDNEEPLRTKLRSAGADILSDVYLLRSTRSNSVSYRVIGNILKTISFLDIASTVGILSAMNCGILRTEFVLLKDSVIRALDTYATLGSEVNLADFFQSESETKNESESRVEKRAGFEIKHPLTPLKRTVESTRIGVQKGEHLLQAISDKMTQKSTTQTPVKTTPKETKETSHSRDAFNVLKKDRREIILNIIKDKKDGATITDIKNAAYGPLKDMGEKTLQRELVAMVAEYVLKKVGDKRWSRYYIFGS